MVGIPETQWAIHLQLMNWARWARPGSSPDVRCYSAESRWRSPQTWHPPQPRVEIQQLQAARMEDMVRNLEDPWRFILRACYVWHRHPQVIVRRLRLSDHNEIETLLIQARHKIQVNSLATDLVAA